MKAAYRKPGELWVGAGPQSFKTAVRKGVAAEFSNLMSEAGERGFLLLFPDDSDTALRFYMTRGARSGKAVSYGMERFAIPSRNIMVLANAGFYRPKGVPNE